MTEESPLEYIKALSEPATLLIEKISDGIGMISRPWIIKRDAKAEVDADLIRALSDINISDLKRRALLRAISEEVRNQYNIESITAKAIPLLDEKANPTNMDDDWIVNFFGKSRSISDDDMQILWARILAGEANSPGSFSRRTINFMGSLGRDEADHFLNLSRFICNISIPGNFRVPLIFNKPTDFYIENGMYFGSLQILDSIGLISFTPNEMFRLRSKGKFVTISYYDESFTIEFEKDEENKIETGIVILSKIGYELINICTPVEIAGYIDFLKEHYSNEYKIT